MASEQAKELRRQGIAAAKAGQKDQARQFLQQSLRLEPSSEAAWLWLTSVARDQRERLFCLQKLLEINPNNEMGLQSLQQLGLTREQLAQQAQAQGQATSPGSSTASAPTAAPQTPGIPMPDAERISQAQVEADKIVREYIAPIKGYPGVTWVHKTRRRAGERDSLYLRMYLAGGAAALLVVLLGIGLIVINNNPELRGIVFAPTWTLSPTPQPPTLTPTPTAGVTPTPSPTPELTLTPSPTVPPDIIPVQSSGIQATAIYPAVQEKGVRDAIALLDAGQFEIALPTLDVEVTRVASSFDPKPYYFLALAYVQKGDLEAAAEVMNDAEARLPERPNDNFKPLVDAGIAYINLKMAERSIADGDRNQASTQLSNAEDRSEAAIDGDARLELPYVTLAERYRIDQNYDLAISVLDQGLSVPELHSNLNLIVAKGNIYFEQGEYDRSDYQAFLALYIDPTIEAAHLLQIRSAMAQDKPGLAVLLTQSYLFYYPGSVEGYRLLGEARVAEGNNDLALEAYNQALAGGDNAEILLARAALYNGQRRYEQARDDLTNVFNLTDDPQVRAQRMLAAYNTGNYATAADDAEELLGENVIPDEEIYLLQARMLIDEAEDNEADYEEALELLNQAGDNLPGDLLPIANEYRARAQYNLEEYTDALRLVNEALTATETGSRYYLRGLIQEAQGDGEAALRDYDWVLTLSAIYPYPFLPDVRERYEALRETQES